jgi:hypothetical protein
VGCPRLIAALPVRLGRLLPDPVVPATATARAWGRPPVIVACGGRARADPAARSRANRVGVDHVSWRQLRSGGTVRWWTVRDGTPVQLTVPAAYPVQAGFVVDVSRAIRRGL